MFDIHELRYKKTRSLKKHMKSFDLFQNESQNPIAELD